MTRDKRKFQYVRALGVMLIPFAAPAAWQPAAAFPLNQSLIRISRTAHPHMPFTVAGGRGAIFGQQDGSFEIWQFPNKIASHFGISAELENYPIPIELAEYASFVEVQPDRTTITYSHAAFTVKQHMFAARRENGDAGGAVVFFEISSVRSLALTIRFTPDMLRMWPASNFGRPSAEWVSVEKSGYYILHTDNEAFIGYIGMPGSTPGVLAPYQERPKTYPAEFRLRFDPKTQSKQFFPLLVARSAAELTELSGSWPALYRETANYYDHFFDHRVTVSTPDPQFDLAIRFAELAIDQSRVQFGDETGLAAGYYSSADSARPGFGWFFGRDTLFTLFAVNSYGDWNLSRAAMRLLIQRQRADGKIMHEFSQAADLVDWKATPYFYASADSTPLLVMAFEDYVRVSGDIAFVREHWDSVKRAYAFTRAHDSDRDGIYENTEGTGWVESWPPPMPHQEIYLAALDQQSCTAMERLARTMGDMELAKSAGSQAELIRKHLMSEYRDEARHMYAFSRNADGSQDHTATVFPSIAWWTGTLSLEDSDPMLTRWASHEFSSDWGIRDVSRTDAIYDPISYHQGSVWPLYTGWASLAEYRAGCSLSGFSHLMQNAEQTFTQDLGAVTELLSGDYFQPFGRSSSHQLWSSAMVLTPALRGLFGIDVDVTSHALTVHPQLPASWNEATVRNVAVGQSRSDIHMRRNGKRLTVEVISRDSARHTTEIDLPAIELELPHGLPAPGSVTVQPKVLRQEVRDRSAEFEIEGQGGTAVDAVLRLNRERVSITGAERTGGKLRIKFPAGEGYRSQTIRFSW